MNVGDIIYTGDGYVLGVKNMTVYLVLNDKEDIIMVTICHFEAQNALKNIEHAAMIVPLKLNTMHLRSCGCEIKS